MNFSKQKNIAIIAITLILNLIIIGAVIWVSNKNNNFKEILISNDALRAGKGEIYKINELNFINEDKYVMVTDSNKNIICKIDKNNKGFNLAASRLGIK